MEYRGKLYGKIGNKYFDTGKTTDDYDELEAFVNKHKEALIIDGVSQRSELLKALGKEIDIDLVSGKKCRILKTAEESYLIQENGKEQIRWVGVSEIKTKSL